MRRRLHAVVTVGRIVSPIANIEILVGCDRTRGRHSEMLSSLEGSGPSEAMKARCLLLPPLEPDGKVCSWFR
jgi:hypothetical protein